VRHGLNKLAADPAVQVIEKLNLVKRAIEYPRVGFRPGLSRVGAGQQDGIEGYGSGVNVAGQEQA